MHSKNHRLNHDFQIDYFLVGACHTPDQAYALLLDLKEDRELALNMAKVNRDKTLADIYRHQAVIDSFANKSEEELTLTEKADLLEAQAELKEIEVMQEANISNINAAIDELNHINELLEKIEPMRKFRHLPLEKAIEAAQREEWKYELLDRAVNSIITAGGITNEDLKNLRLHPDFETELNPKLKLILQKQNELRLARSEDDANRIEKEIYSLSNFFKPDNMLEDKSTKFKVLDGKKDE